VAQQNIRYHLVFFGEVQGVGFRFTSRTMAVQRRITGWVRNTDGGQVEITAEGDPGDLKDFVGELKGCFSDYITGCEVNESQATGEFTRFDIHL